MTRAGRDEDPDRLYTLTGGRSRPGTDEFDIVTLVVSESEPVPGMQSEHAAILRICRAPTAVVELSAVLGLPVSITKILLSDLLAEGRITARHPRSAPGSAPGKVRLADPTTLEKVLVGLRDL